MKHSIARREFLRQVGLSFGAVSAGSVLFDAFMGPLLNKAFASTTATAAASNYIHMSFPGAPPRWYFDLPLAPGGVSASNFKQGSFGTLFEKSGSTFKPTYAVEKVSVGGQALYLPPVWNMSTGSQDFTSVLQNTLFIRGMDMEINNHQLSNEKQVAPIIGGYSLTGVVADKSTYPVPAIIDNGVAASTAFRSVKGLASTAITYNTNPAVALLAPFKNYLNGSMYGTTNATELQTQAMQKMEQYAANKGFSPSVLSDAYDRSVQLMESDVYTSLSGQWSALVAKYQALIKGALDTNFKHTGFNDKPILADTSTSYGTHASNGTTGQVQAGTDIRNLITSSTDATNMATNFAIAELMLKGKISSSFCLGFSPLVNLSTMTSGVVNFNPTHDQHFMGLNNSIIINTYFYRCFLSCMTEFVAQLKAAGIFGNTVVHISAEFSRTPRADSVGADHAYQGSGATLISGMLPGPAVIGNVHINSGSTTYPGTWGYAAPYPLDGFKRPIQTNDVARQISTMLNVTDIVTNGMNLLQNNGGTYVPRLPNGYSAGTNNVA